MRSKEEIESFGVRCWTVKGDIGNNAEAIIQESINKAKRIDFLINNASIFPIEEFSINDLNYIFSVNSWGPLLLIREFTKVSKKGKIINILDSIISSVLFKC